MRGHAGLLFNSNEPDLFLIMSPCKKIQQSSCRTADVIGRASVRKKIIRDSGNQLMALSVKRDGTGCMDLEGFRHISAEIPGGIGRFYGITHVHDSFFFMVPEWPLFYLGEIRNLLLIIEGIWRIHGYYNDRVADQRSAPGD